jgi:WhiB family transcriptional regulator, redox-sensing transcriptional regulator
MQHARIHRPSPQVAQGPGDSAGIDWRQRALCRDEDPELFFPAGTTGPAERQVGQAKAVCRRCAVTSQCLSWALDTGQDFGVWVLIRRSRPAVSP